MDFVFKHVDTTYVWEALSFAHAITDGEQGTGLENRYLKRVLSCGPGYTQYPNMLHGFYDQTSSPSVEDSKNWIGIVGKLRSLGVK